MSTLSELEYYCHEENSFGALMFTGEWGCGKTYLIEHELADRLGEDFIIIRISLFGESSVESINRKVQKAYFQEAKSRCTGFIIEFVMNSGGKTVCRNKKVSYNRERDGRFYVSGGFTHSFPLFAGDKQRLHAGIPGFMGAAQGNRHSRQRGFYASGLAAGAEGKACAGRQRIVCAEKRVPNQGRAGRSFPAAAFCYYRRDQLHL